MLSWRGLAYYYSLFNLVANVSIIMNLLQEVTKVDNIDGQTASKWTLSDIFFRQWFLQDGLSDIFHHSNLFQFHGLQDLQESSFVDL